MTRIETVGIICEKDYVLLGFKKIKFGAGKYNGPGGGVKKNEILEKAMIRETKEEFGIKIKNPEHMGKIFYQFDGGEQDHIIHFFKITEYEGSPRESDEMIPKWFYRNSIPYEKMWEDSKYWLPFLLKDKKFYGEVCYDEEKKIKNYFVNDVKMKMVTSQWP